MHIEYVPHGPRVEVQDITHLVELFETVHVCLRRGIPGLFRQNFSH